MSDRTAEPSPVETEAAAWFARLGRQSVSTTALREFRAWKAIPGNAEAYARVESAWDAADALRHDPELRAATRAALDRTSPERRRRRRNLVLASLGGLAAPAATGAGGLFLANRPTYETRTGEQRLVVLQDGSRVRLNTDTAVKVRFAHGERRIDLARGEALFEAAHDTSRPFIVQAGGIRVRAVGTRFDVRQDGGGTRVTLLEGRVRVTQDRSSAVADLNPNETLSVRQGRMTRPIPADGEAAASWATGRLTFRGLPLEAAVAEVNRYARRKIRLDVDPEIAGRPVTGVFDAGDTQAFASAVEAVFDLQPSEEPDGLRLSSR